MFQKAAWFKLIRVLRIKDTNWRLPKKESRWKPQMFEQSNRWSKYPQTSVQLEWETKETSTLREKTNSPQQNQPTKQTNIRT